MAYSFNLPLNSLSFGQTSLNILYECYKRDLDTLISPIGANIDLSSGFNEVEFKNWIIKNSERFLRDHKRSNKIFKLWHLNGGLESFSEKQILLSFYELDSPTPEEINIARNNYKIAFSTEHYTSLFKKTGCENVEKIPLAFDKNSFYKIDKVYNSNRIIFNLTGKLERRKHHLRIINLWAKKYGNNPKYSLQCAIYNPFLKIEDQQALISSALENKKYFNITFLNYMQDNSTYNDYLNSANIILGLSGGEGWGLPEFHSIGIGKYGIILDAHGYKEWANKENSILVKPSKNKIEAYDNIFFQKGAKFNQGNLFNFEDEDFYSACENAELKVLNNPVNEKGILLQKRFTIEKTVDKILELLK
jgi:hypothetical protein